MPLDFLSCELFCPPLSFLPSVELLDDVMLAVAALLFVLALDDDSVI